MTHIEPVAVILLIAFIAVFLRVLGHAISKANIGS